MLKHVLNAASSTISSEVAARLDRLLSRLADVSVGEQLSLTVVIDAVPELRQTCGADGFTNQINLRVAQNLLQDAPPSTPWPARADLKRRAVTGHVGGQLNCWFQLNTTATCGTGRGSDATAAQLTLGFLPKECTGRALRIY